MALGLLFIAKSRDSKSNSYLFGNILLITKDDLNEVCALIAAMFKCALFS
jgi:ABC-type Mn2+/Zn2+ transport system permease subunit